VAQASPAFAVLNFANAKMVGDAGNIEATVKGVETVDQLPVWRL
jgi:bisphosphoglycerate-independent phosphoglycerate mutase (AlkP superfamily)